MGCKAGSGDWLLLGGLCVAALSWQLACDPGQAPSSAATAALLAAVGPEVVEPALERFLGESQALSAELEQLGQGGQREQAQAQLLRTMAAWQELELMQIGPAGSSLYVVGGQDLRDTIYSWPTTNPCRVDQETTEAAWADPSFFQDNLVNSYGLDAIERLLFAPPEHACPSQVGIDAVWSELGPQGVEAARTQYALALSEHNEQQARALLDSWQRWGPVLAQGSEPYAGTQDALNSVFDALFYIELQTTDSKLAEVLEGEEPEAPLSQSSATWIHHNLLGFQALFFATEDSGFDLLLEELGHADLAEEVAQATDLALELSAPLQDLEQDIRQDPQAVEQLLQALRTLSTLLKADVATVLSLQVPQESAGDND